MKIALLLTIVGVLCTGLLVFNESSYCKAERIFSSSVSHEDHGAYIAAALGYQLVIERYPNSFRAEEASRRLKTIRRFNPIASKLTGR
jgi:hypothetical protein